MTVDDIVDTALRAISFYDFQDMLEIRSKMDVEEAIAEKYRQEQEALRLLQATNDP